jgi:hypothetical protein
MRVLKVLLTFGLGSALLAGCAGTRWQVQEVRYSYADSKNPDDSFDSREVILLDRHKGETWMLTTAGEGDDVGYFWQKLTREDAGPPHARRMLLPPPSPMAAMPRPPR